MIGIIAAMEIEAKGLIEKLSEPKSQTILGITFTQGHLHNKELVVAVSGVGKVNAGLCTGLMLHAYHPTMLFSIGVAGSISFDVNLLDICVASFVCQHDFDTTAFGDPAGLLPGHKTVQMNCDTALVKLLADAAGTHGKVCVAGMACGDQFIATENTKLSIQKAFDCVACEMESGSIGQVATQNHIPFAVIRVISDSLTDGAEMEFEAFKVKAAEKTVAVICDAVAAL